MSKSKFPAKNDQPDNIKDKSASSKVTKLDFPAERPQHKAGNLKTLQAKRYTNNSNAKNQADQKPSY